MKISAFTYVRNGNRLGYPFVQSIKSLLPLVDEYIAVVGDSTDGTREAIEGIDSDKIKIIDTYWDDAMRKGGKIFAQQANIGFDAASKDSDWLFHLQADEIIHEDDLGIIKQSLEQNINNKEVEGFLLRFINFFGDYDHYCPSRRFHQREIRIVRNDPHIRSYKDSMGFRKFIDPQDDNEKGTKLWVKQIEATIYHYSWAKPPKKQKAKQIAFTKRYDPNDDFIKEYEEKYGDAYDYRDYDYLKKFSGTHPAVMQQEVASQDWVFKYDPSKSNMNFKEKFMKLAETITGKQFFIYKNYKVLKEK
jgi:glycosyltransferase involved in cell wall biosynthesis